MRPERMTPDLRWMEEALREAGQAGQAGEVPVGAVVVRGDEVLARGRNRVETLRDPSAHAELLAIRSASLALKYQRLSGCTLYVTLEPCAMCAGAIVLARGIRPQGRGLRLPDERRAGWPPEPPGHGDAERAGSGMRGAAQSLLRAPAQAVKNSIFCVHLRFQPLRRGG